jgi:signal transduction histidine kinase
MTSCDEASAAAPSSRSPEGTLTAWEIQAHALEDRLLFEQTLASVAQALNALPTDSDPLRDIRQEVDCLAVVLGYDRCILWALEGGRAVALARHERACAVLSSLGSELVPEEAPWLFAAVKELRVGVPTKTGGVRATAGIPPRIPQEPGYVLHVEVADALAPWVSLADAGRVGLVCELLVAALRRARDTRDLRRLREASARVDHASRLGQLAAGIAHEVNQPLAATLCNIQAAARLLERPTLDVAEIRAAVDDAVQTVRRAAEVVRRIRALFGRGTLDRKPVDLRGLIGEAAAVVRPDMDNVRAVLTLQVASVLPMVMGDSVQLLQMLLNLLTNAADAVRQVPPHERTVTVSADLDELGAVRVAVEDTGVGLPHGAEDDLFHPFFTTKPSGIGMGLPICRQVAEAHGGTIHAERPAHRGSRFVVLLPAAG